MEINTFLHILIGFVGLVCLAIPFSNDIKKINIKHIVYGILFQLVLDILISQIYEIFKILTFFISQHGNFFQQ